jgi:hypothetical protein
VNAFDAKWLMPLAILFGPPLVAVIIGLIRAKIVGVEPVAKSGEACQWCGLRTGCDASDDMVERVKAFVAVHTLYPRRRMTLDTRLMEDVGLDGDDAVELFRDFAVHFEVDLSEINWDRHFGPEGCNPVFALWYWTLGHRKHPMVPVTISDLVVAAEARRWGKDYLGRAVT